MNLIFEELRRVVAAFNVCIYVTVLTLSPRDMPPHQDPDLSTKTMCFPTERYLYILPYLTRKTAPQGKFISHLCCCCCCCCSYCYCCYCCCCCFCCFCCCCCCCFCCCCCCGGGVGCDAGGKFLPANKLNICRLNEARLDARRYFLSRPWDSLLWTS